MSLLMAYALNLNPNQNLAGSMPKATFGANTMSITFHAASFRIGYIVQTSTDLEEWVTDGVLLSDIGRLGGTIKDLRTRVTEGVTISELDPANMRTVTVERDEARRYLRLAFGMSP